VIVDATVELLWIPLGAGQRVVRCSGWLFEAAVATIQRRPRCGLYHSALVISVPAARYTVEMTPVPDADGAARGVVGEGAVGSSRLGRLRVFRYEIRCWPNGVIPDADAAAATVQLPADDADAQALLDLAPHVPTAVWGRDELRAGEMWNSNSVTSWLLSSAGFDVGPLSPPDGGRAPGWDAGCTVAARQPRTRT
jgi:hypothetical protein